MSVSELYYVVSTTVYLILSLVEVAMFVRALFSWIFADAEGLIIDFVYLLTEPIILPFRKLFEKLGWFQNSPLDIAYLFAVISLGVITTFITMI